MLTLYHSPESRSVAILSLIEEMGIQDWVEVRTVTIPRMDGSGGRDPANPHPEGKVPALVHDGVVLTERAAIILHLTSLFPDSAMAPKVGTPEWGAFATWMAWYQGVLEPAFILEGAGVSHPWLTAARFASSSAGATARTLPRTSVPSLLRMMATVPGCTCISCWPVSSARHSSRP